MLVWLAWASYITVVHSLAPCRTSTWQSAFLSNVTNGLPDSRREHFCSDTSLNRLIINPASTGVSHYVLAGNLETSLLQKPNDTYGVLRVGEIAANGVEQTPVLLHIWLRALCIG